MDFTQRLNNQKITKFISTNDNLDKKGFYLGARKHSQDTSRFGKL